MYGVVIFYDDGPELLRRCLESLRPVCERVVAIDGAYEAFPHKSPRSHPDTLRIALSGADFVWTRSHSWRDEIEKRNAYLRLVPDGEWTLMLDADEELVGTPEPPEVGPSEYRLMLHRDDRIPPYSICRLWRSRTPLYYAGVHNALHDRDGVIDQRSAPVLEGAHIMHYTQEREALRRQQKAVYYRHLRDSEATWRNAQGRLL